jgi:hypothetical protein
MQEITRIIEGIENQLIVLIIFRGLREAIYKIFGNTDIKKNNKIYEMSII